MGWAVGWFWILLMGLKDSSQMSLDQHHWSFGPQAWGLEASANFGTELHHRPYGVSNNFLYLSCLYTWPNPIEWFSCGCLMVSLTWFFLHPSTLANSSTTIFLCFFFFQGTPLFSSPKTPLGCISLVGHIIGRDEGRGNRLLRHPRGHLYDIETKPGSSKWPLK